MKKLLCCLLAALCLVSTAFAEPLYESHRVSFEDGFSLSLPADWVSYPVAPELAEVGALYCLGSADGTRLMYISREDSAFETDAELFAELQKHAEIELRSTEDAEVSNGFYLYNFTESDASGCAALLDGSVLSFLFTPLSDAENMLIAASVIDSYAVNAEE